MRGQGCLRTPTAAGAGKHAAASRLGPGGIVIQARGRAQARKAKSAEEAV